MNYTEFKKSIIDGEVCSAYLFEGEDSFFKDNGLLYLKDKFIHEPSLNFTVFDGSTVGMDELMASLSTFPFMDEKRITAVKEFYPKAEAVKSRLEEFIGRESSDSILVIMNEKPCDTLKKCKGICVVDCKKADENTIAKWIIFKCKSDDVTIDLETAKLLSECCLCDMKRIEIETEKLISYVGKNGVIDKAVIDLNIYRDFEYKIYEMTDYISNKNFDKAIAVINEMLYRGETPQKVLSSVYNYFRRLLHVMISDKGNDELASVFGVKEYAVKKMKEQAGKFKVRTLKKAVDLLVESDYKVKSGIMDVNEQMWLSVFSIMVDGGN